MVSSSAHAPPIVAIIGGGPAGLMAAEVLLRGGAQVELFDAMPSLGRKFLLAGKGGLNLTHAEPFDRFVTRYGEREPWLRPMLEHFGPAQLQAWARELGVETFVGSSGRVFPTAMKAAPLLRAWLHRLRESGLKIHARHRWSGWDAYGKPLLVGPNGIARIEAQAWVLALGGGSWARLGSDGAWIEWLRKRGVAVAPLRPANCGFDVDWSDHFRERYAGAPVKTVSACVPAVAGFKAPLQGECVITETGIEGGLIYALSAPLRDTLERTGTVTLQLDLMPAHTLEQVATALAKARGTRSCTDFLRRQLGLKGVKLGLVREVIPAAVWSEPACITPWLKALPVRLRAPRPLDEAISSAGGVPQAALDTRLMLRALPGVFCAGEMLDWEAPTGGYLLTACCATGRAAGHGALHWLGLTPAG